MSDGRAYFRNSLHAWREGLLKQRPAMEARLKTMKAARHPDANDQEILLILNANMIEVCDAALREADAIQRAQELLEKQATP